MLPEVQKPRLWVIVSGTYGQTGQPTGIWYRYNLPTTTPTPTTTQTPTPTGTPSPSQTGSTTATLSVGAQPSITATGTTIPTPTASAGYTASGTPTATPTATLTSAPQCYNQVPTMAIFNGLSGQGNLTLASNVAGATNDGPIIGVTPCANYSVTAYNKHLYIVNLPPDVPLGGTLDVNTCVNANATTLDTVIWVSGCCIL